MNRKQMVERIAELRSLLAAFTLPDRGEAGSERATQWVAEARIREHEHRRELTDLERQLMRMDAEGPTVSFLEQISAIEVKLTHLAGQAPFIPGVVYDGRIDVAFGDLPADPYEKMELRQQDEIEQKRLEAELFRLRAQLEKMSSNKFPDA